MTTDKDTGLPELPDGYVWRVREETFFGYLDHMCKSLAVDICRRRWFGLEQIVSDSLMDWDAKDSYILVSKDPTPENIRACAVKVHRKFERKMGEQVEQLAEAEARKKLVGTYPPKKLNY